MKKESELVEIKLSEASESFSKEEMELIEKTKVARSQAYAPYSNFNVGAAALLENGAILKGNNQENAAYPSGLCAERVLLNFVKANFPKEDVRAIAIITDHAHIENHNVPVPCGACLQTILETERRQEYPIKIILIGYDTYFVADGIRQFLPFQFDLDQ